MSHGNFRQQSPYFNFIIHLLCVMQVHMEVSYTIWWNSKHPYYCPHTSSSLQCRMREICQFQRNLHPKASFIFFWEQEHTVQRAIQTWCYLKPCALIFDENYQTPQLQTTRASPFFGIYHLPSPGFLRMIITMTNRFLRIWSNVHDWQPRAPTVWRTKRNCNIAFGHWNDK